MRNITTLVVRPVLLLALAALLVTTMFATHARPADAQQYSEAQYAGQGPITTATGVLERAAPHEPDPTPVYALTDEATGTPYELTSGFVELEPFVGQRVTIEGVPVPGNPPPGAPVFLNVTAIAPAGDPGGGTDQGVSAAGVVEELEMTSFGYGTHALVDAGTGAISFALQSESVNLDEHVDEQVTVHGSLVAGYEDGLDGGPPLIEVLGVEATPPGGGEEETATLFFELTVEGEPLAAATFSGVTSLESSIAVPLTDPDGDGLYTGDITVPATGGGQGVRRSRSRCRSRSCRTARPS